MKEINNSIIIGSGGTGKTTWCKRKIEKYIHENPKNKVFVYSEIDNYDDYDVIEIDRKQLNNFHESNCLLIVDGLVIKNHNDNLRGLIVHAIQRSVETFISMDPRFVYPELLSCTSHLYLLKDYNSIPHVTDRIKKYFGMEIIDLAFYCVSLTDRYEIVPIDLRNMKVHAHPYTFYHACMMMVADKLVDMDYSKERIIQNSKLLLKLSEYGN